MNTDTKDKPKVSLRDALLRRHRAARNTSQIAMFSPSPCISKYGAGKRQAVAKNAGTSEGVKKSWETRRREAMSASHQAMQKSKLYQSGPSRSTGERGAVYGAHMDASRLHDRLAREAESEGRTDDWSDHATIRDYHQRVARNHLARLRVNLEDNPFTTHNSGTSAGVRKAWETRKHHFTYPVQAEIIKGGQTHSVTVKDVPHHAESYDAGQGWRIGRVEYPEIHHVEALAKKQHGGDVKVGKVTRASMEDIHEHLHGSGAPLTGPGSWLHAQGQKTPEQADADERQAVARGRLLRHLNKSKRPKPMPVHG